MSEIEGFRLSPVQRRIWAADRRDGLGTCRAWVWMNEPVDRPRLAEALRVLGSRHEALRLRVVEYPGLRVPRSC